MEPNWKEKQPVRGPEVICSVCGKLDNVWFCKDRQHSTNGSGQYVWEWTTCCDKFMRLYEENQEETPQSSSPEANQGDPGQA